MRGVFGYYDVDYMFVNAQRSKLLCMMIYGVSFFKSFE